MKITLTQLRQIAPKGDTEILKGVVKYFNKYSEEYRINTFNRAVNFLAQAAHETAGFDTLEEYASGSAYEGRSDLGNTKSGDGVKYKGRGIFMYTGRYNYTKLGEKLGVDLVSNPKLLQENIEYAVLSAFIYWNERNLNKYADHDNIETITRKINGGLNGFTDRKRYRDRARTALKTQNFYDLWEVQQKLKDLGYVEVGKVDGIRGPKTDSAIVAFKVDQTTLPANNEITKEFLEALDKGQYRVVEDRADVTVKDLRKEGSKTIKATDGATAGGVGTAVIGLTVAAEKNGWLDGLNVSSFLDNYAWVIFVLIALFVQWQILKVVKARVQDHKKGNTNVVGLPQEKEKDGNVVTRLIDKFNPFS